MGALHVDTAVREADGRLTAVLSRDWNIWGPNGGYVAAVGLRAAGAIAPPDHRPATLSVQYISVGEFDEVACEATPMKKGRNAWLINVALVQKGRTFLQAQVWTTNKQDGPGGVEARMPKVAHPDSLKSYAELTPPEAPPPHGFWMNFDGKPLEWRGWDAPRVEHPPILHEWYRFRDYEPGDVWLDFCRPVILIDTLIWPAHHRGRKEAPDYIAPSLDLTVWFHQPAGEAEWLLVDATADVAGGGLIHGRNRIWTPDGRLVATGGSNMLHVARG